MKTPADIMKRLARLEESDRAWILERLSPAAKRSLLQASQDAGERQDVAADRAPATAAHAAPASHEAPAVVEKKFGLPHGEPGWLIAAMLQAHEEPDRAVLWQRLPGPLRHEVENVRRCGMVLTDSMRECLLRLSEKCSDGAALPPSRTTFETLVDKLTASRARRRFWRKR